MSDWRSKGFSSFADYLQSFSFDENETATANEPESMEVDDPDAGLDPGPDPDPDAGPDPDPGPYPDPDPGPYPGPDRGSESEICRATTRNDEQFDRLDIGRYAGKLISEDLKKELLRSPWTPPPDYSFPPEKIGPQNRYFNPAWLFQFEWLTWSEASKGGLCKYCVLFAPDNVRNQKLQVFVTSSFKNYKKATGKGGILSAHEEAAYHKFAVERANAFLQRLEGIKL